MLNLIRNHLLANAVGLASVEVLENLEALANMTTPESGAAFVIPFRERAAPNRLMGGGFRQNITRQVLVAFIVRVDDDPSGAGRISQFDGYMASIHDAMAGWQPENCNQPFELVGGEATPLSVNSAAYVETWETAYLLTGK